jgi:nucleoid-associated protein YgaU
MKNILAENLLRFGAKNLSQSDKTRLSEQNPKTGNIVQPPAGATEIVPYKVVQGDTLWSIATKWIQDKARVQQPTDEQITNFVKTIVSDTNALKNFNINLPGADTEIKNPNLIKPGMVFYLPVDKNEILKVNK